MYRNIENLLINTKTSHSLPVDSHSLTWVNKEDPLPVAFKKLIERHVSSLPVCSEPGKAIGFLDLVDILFYFLNIAEKSLLEQTENDREILRQKLFSSVSCRDIMNYSRRNSFVAVTGETMLMTSLGFLMESNVRRLPVLRPDDSIIGILSHLDVLKWLQKHGLQEFKALEVLFKKSVEELGLLNEVVTIVDTQTAKEAFYMMRDSGHSSIGVVNTQRKLVGTLSIYDLNPIGFDSKLFRILSLPLVNYMEEFLEPKRIITVQPEDTLGKALDLFVNNGIHQVYIVDKDKQICGLISPIDIINLLVKNKRPH